MSKRKNILFIAWDGPYVSYLEGLFVPIMAQLNKQGYSFHVLHFSWAESQHVLHTAETCSRQNIPYAHVRIGVWPHPVIGKYVTLLGAHKHLVKYVREHSIDVVMPRTTMPSRIVLATLKYCPDLVVVFDADGLPIEERVDFAGLKKNSVRYNQLKRIERAIVEKAQIILARSNKAIDFLIKQYGESQRGKFSRILNGRDESLFQRSSLEMSNTLRASLDIPADAFVSVYCGSLGPQYGVHEMEFIHEQLLKNNPNTYWLVLTGNTGYFGDRFAAMKNVIVRRVSAEEVPAYLSVANIAFALRKATFSMMGVSPIKLGEYLLLGLPTIASAGIGDTEEILSNKKFCFLLPDLSEDRLLQAVNWIVSEANAIDSIAIRKFGELHFGLKMAVESYRIALAKII